MSCSPRSRVGRRARCDERGLALSVWVAVALPAFIVAVGLGVDFAGHAAAEQEARAIAAQAARSATHAVVLTGSGAQLDAGAARRAGRGFAEAAGLSAEVNLTPQLGAEVRVRGSYSTVFLGLIGISSIDVEATGVARAVSAGG